MPITDEQIAELLALSEKAEASTPKEAEYLLRYDYTEAACNLAPQLARELQEARNELAHEREMKKLAVRLKLQAQDKCDRLESELTTLRLAYNELLEAAAAVYSAYGKARVAVRDLCSNPEHKPLRFPGCKPCQLAARIEELGHLAEVARKGQAIAGRKP